MKKLIIAAVLLIVTSVQMMAGPIVTIKIRIGKNAEECNKFGICWRDSGASVDFALVANGTEGGTTLQINEITENLDITVPASIWKEKSNYFSGSEVVFEEDVNLGQKVSNLLKSSTIIIVRSGKYPIKKDRSNNVIISIPLNSIIK